MKRGLDWYAREPRAFVDGVRAAKMTARQIAVYTVALDLIYDGGGETPDDPKHIASYFSDMGTSAARATIEELVQMGKLFRVGGMLRPDYVPPSTDYRPPIPSWMKDVVIQRDGCCCVYCGQRRGPFEIDHVTPWSRGGNHSIENLTIACRACNRSKGAKTVEEWRGQL